MLRSLLLAICCVIFPDVVRAADPQPKSVDFERHVMGLLSKVGCNSGSCHGSFQGKNGFRLSLFGFDPEKDYTALTRDTLGRRINLNNPDDSLLLQKGSGAVAHDGGMRFGKDAWVYNTFKDWIAKGATWTPGSGTIAALTLTPADFVTVKGGEQTQITVTATFADGSKEDITAFCDFKITDDSVATVTPLGMLTASKPGDAGLTVLYRGAVRAARVLVPAPTKAGFVYPTVKPVNAIDREVFAKLKMLNMVPSELSSDLEFLRRVTIDTTGILPTPEEARAFGNDTDPKKREKKIEQLLKHPLHSALWATKLSDVTGNNTDGLENPANYKTKRSQLWHDWLRKRFADNVPYDRMVRDIVTATSKDDMTPEQYMAFNLKTETDIEKGMRSVGYADKKTLDMFWRRQATIPVEQWGEKVAAAFLGVRLECAQCHKHPTDRWTQDDYWAFANLFSQVSFPNGNAYSDPALKKLADAENAARKEKLEGKNNNQLVLVREMFTAAKATPRPITGTTRVVQPKTLGGPEVKIAAGTDLRVGLAGWLTSPENPFFARSFVNRMWAHYFGIGLVNPVDDFSQANPPTNARLLDLLAQEFIASGFDVRKLETQILLSRSYQLSSQSNETNVFDKNNFAHSYVRPLMAEQVVDVLNSALGVDEDALDQYAKGTKMTEVGATLLNNQGGGKANGLGYILRIFGRPPRTTACDCERAMEPALPQTLFRMTDPTLMKKISDPTGRAAVLAKKKLTDDDVVEELFLATLTRLPNEKEKLNALKYIEDAGTKNRLLAMQEITWALINTREFILNH